MAAHDYATNDLLRRLQTTEDHNRQLTEKLASLTEVTNGVESLHIQSYPREPLPQNASESTRLHRRLQDVQTELYQARHKHHQEAEQLRSQLGLVQVENQTFREDFQREREDRLRAHKELAELRGELERTKKDLAQKSELLSQYTAQSVEHGHRQRQEALQKIRERHYPNSQPRQYVYRQRGNGLVVCDGENERPVGRDEDIVDCLIEPSYEQPLAASSSEVLQCPTCNAAFHINQHLEFLDHVESCR